MNIKVTTVLAVIFILLGSFALFDPLGIKQKKAETKEKEAQVFWLKDRKIEWLEFSYPALKKEKIHFDCVATDGCEFDSSGEWKITTPIQESADSVNLGGFLNSLVRINPVDQLNFDSDFHSEDIKNAEFGIATPRQVLQFKVRGEAKAWSLSIGEKSAIGSNYYVFSSTNPKVLYMVASYFPDLFNKDLFYWRDKRLFPSILDTSINEVSWQTEGKGKKFVFTKKNGNWNFGSPLQAHANNAMVTGMVGSLLHLNATAITAESKNAKAVQAALHKAPVLTVHFKGDKTEGDAKFYSALDKDKDKNLLAMVSTRPWIASIDKNSLEKFKKGIDDFRWLKILTEAENDQIAKLEIQFSVNKNKKVILEKTGEDWKKANAQGDVKFLNINLKRFLNFMVSSGAKEIKKSAEFLKKLQNPSLKLALFDKTGKSIRNLSIFVEADKNHKKLKAYFTGELPGEVKIADHEFAGIIPISENELDHEIQSNTQLVNQPTIDGIDKDAIMKQLNLQQQGH